jgi:alpha,alpha-trehalase
LMWDALRYKQENDVGTLIGTPNDAFKPGERFLEAYYWDTADAATCLLQEAAIDTGAEKYKKEQWVVGLVDNMKHMIERFGYVPNGQRSYYLGRSQPPIFAGIVEQLANYYKERDPDLMERYLPAIVTEYKWWMKDEDKAGRYGHPQAMNHVVRLDDGLILNRHFGLGKPRPESRDEDLRTARDSGRNPVEVFQNLAAGAESGRDYDAADFDNFQDIETIRTINLVKPQLNALLGQSERIIAGAHNTAGRSVLEKEYRDRLARRVAGMNRYNYNSYDGAYYPYDFVNGEQVAVLTMETAYPVARGLSDDTQSDRVTDTMNQMLLQIGGYSASSVKSSQQWSYENGFARDQAEARAANIRAGKEGVALEAATRWLERDDAVYHRLGALAEKNNVVTKQPQMGQGGEYFAQRGFLWSIAVNRQFQRYVVQRQRANLS